MRLRHQSLSHARSESQRTNVYDAVPSRSSSTQAMSPIQSWRSWRSLAAVLLAVALINLFLAKSVRHFFASSELHLLVPVTNSNKYLCQLLLSSIILNYPTPILLGWDSPDRGDSSKRYVAKVNAIQTYLGTFSPARDSDLVLIVDGFDVWFQLPPDVVLRRYFKTINAQNERLASRIPPSARRRNDIRSTILFSADKTCASGVDGGSIGCWAPPQSPMPLYTFGPYNDTSLDDAKVNPYHTRPRWLNSGMILGPAKDLKILFEEISKMINADQQRTPDHWFYSHLFGIQEYSRSLLEKNPSVPADNVRPPEIAPDQRTEFHIGLDYENAVLQNVGYNDQYLTWWQHDRAKDTTITRSAQKKRLHEFSLSQDILKARRPFESMLKLKMSAYNEIYQEMLKKAGRPDFKMWKHLPLATNVATRQVFAMMHFTFEKEYRNIWWEKMWFYPYARDLLRSSASASSKLLYEQRINGRKWYNSQTPLSSYIAGSNQERRDGAWTDKGEWKSFEGTCQLYDEELLGTSYDTSVLSYS